MSTKTLMIFGPGGIGKSPVDALVRADAVRIDPYRLRSTGPRDGGDIFYAHPKLRSELITTLEALGDIRERISTEPSVDWFSKSRVAMFDVRGEWQCILLSALNFPFVKAEIYAPAVSALLNHPDVRSAFGSLSIVVLNPVESLASLGDDFSTLKSATAENCSKRGDSPKSIEKRTNSIEEEARAWQKMLAWGGTEFPNWPFPEYTYREHETATRLAARSMLIKGNPALEELLKSEAELRTAASSPRM